MDGVFIICHLHGYVDWTLHVIHFFIKAHMYYELRKNQYTYKQRYRVQLSNPTSPKGPKKKEIRYRSLNPLQDETCNIPRLRGEECSIADALKVAAIEYRHTSLWKIEAIAEKPISRGHASSTLDLRPELAAAADRRHGTLLVIVD